MYNVSHKRQVAEKCSCGIRVVETHMFFLDTVWLPHLFNKLLSKTDIFRCCNILDIKHVAMVNPALHFKSCSQKRNTKTKQVGFLLLQNYKKRGHRILWRKNVWTCSFTGLKKVTYQVIKFDHNSHVIAPTYK